MSETETGGSGLSAEHRPWCCPEPRCIPIHTLQGAETPLSMASPGESFVCFGDAPEVRFEYDGVVHINDTRTCHYTPLKGLIAYQENAEDWQAVRSAYWRAFEALKARRGGSLDLLVNERTGRAIKSDNNEVDQQDYADSAARRDDATRGTL